MAHQGNHGRRYQEGGANPDKFNRVHKRFPMSLYSSFAFLASQFDADASFGSRGFASDLTEVGGLLSDLHRQMGGFGISSGDDF
jgi:hypothetical protein